MLCVWGAFWLVLVLMGVVAVDCAGVFLGPGEALAVGRGFVERLAERHAEELAGTCIFHRFSRMLITGVLRFQSSLFQIFNTLVRASAESRDAVLQYFSTAISLNVKRGAMQASILFSSSSSF